MSELTRRPGESIVEFARRSAAALQYTIKQPEPEPSQTVWDDDLIPQVDPPKRSQEQLDMDVVLGGVDIVEAYNRWCKKMHCDPGSKRESIMVSCPNPQHPDATPSAWITLDKGDGGVGNCGSCGIGFDKYDIAAWRFGFGVPDYKSKEDFPALRRKMAEDLGYKVVMAGKDEWLVKETEPASEPVVTPIPIQVEPEALNEIAHIGEELDVIGKGLTFNWRDLPLFGDRNSFLRTWMDVTSESYEPDEFYFFLGLQALAAAIGNKVTYQDYPPVRGNLLVCVIGPTGAGKSIAISCLDDLLSRALPWNEVGGGVKMIAAPGSGEALLDEFNYFTTDPVTKERTDIPVNGLFKDNELAALVKRITRSGNTSREIIMDLFDRAIPVGTSSRGHGTVFAKDHFMQMVTSTQSGSISTLLSDTDAVSGFLNRWLYIFGELKMRPARNAKMIDIEPCVDPLQRIRAWGSSGQLVQWHDQAAGELWDAFYLESIYPLKIQEDAWIVARVDLLAKKLLLLFAVNDRSKTITMEHVQTLVALWPYLMRTYGIIEEQVGQDDLEAVMNDVEAYMKKHEGEHITVRQLHKNSAARKFNKEILIKAVDLMCRAGFIQEVPRPKSDRVPRYTWSSDVQHVTPTLSVIAGGKA